MGATTYIRSQSRAEPAHQMSLPPDWSRLSRWLVERRAAYISGKRSQPRTNGSNSPTPTLHVRHLEPTRLDRRSSNKALFSSPHLKAKASLPRNRRLPTKQLHQRYRRHFALHHANSQKPKMPPAQRFPPTLKGKERDPPPSRLPHVMNEPPPRRTEMQEEVEKRERAAMILDSWELLAMYSRKYREVGPTISSIPTTGINA